jgi:hypothetical protein
MRPHSTSISCMGIVQGLRVSQWWLWRIPSSGMWRRVVLMWADVLDERIAIHLSCWFLARRFFYPEYGGHAFLQNVGSYKTIFFTVTWYPRDRDLAIRVKYRSFVNHRDYLRVWHQPCGSVEVCIGGNIDFIPYLSPVKYFCCYSCGDVGSDSRSNGAG